MYVTIPEEINAVWKCMKEDKRYIFYNVFLPAFNAAVKDKILVLWLLSFLYLSFSLSLSLTHTVSLDVLVSVLRYISDGGQRAAGVHLGPGEEQTLHKYSTLLYQVMQ